MTKTIPVGIHGKEALVDDEDFEAMSRFRWSESAHGYAFRLDYSKGGAKFPEGVFMHRLILDAPDDKRVDHKNGNILDNRRANIRLCTQRENMYNSRKKCRSWTGKPTASQYKGVSRAKAGRWRSQIRIPPHGKLLHLGVFDTEFQAYTAYRVAATKYHGEFAHPG